MNEPIDYRELLIKYMALVISEESVSYVELLHPDRFVTQADCDELCAIEPEARKLSHRW